MTAFVVRFPYLTLKVEAARSSEAFRPAAVWTEMITLLNAFREAE
jgi:hypothetical protein